MTTKSEELRDWEKAFDERFNHDNPFGVAVVIIEVDQHGISTQRPGQHDLKQWFAHTLQTEIEKAVEAERRLLFSKAEFVFHKTQRGRYMPDVHLFRQELKHYFEIDSLSHNKEVK